MIELNFGISDREMINYAVSDTTNNKQEETEFFSILVNPLQCDCNLSWTCRSPFDASGTCKSPSHLAGKPLEELSADQLC